LHELIGIIGLTGEQKRGPFGEAQPAPRCSQALLQVLANDSLAAAALRPPANGSTWAAFLFSSCVSFLVFLSQKTKDHQLKSSPVLFLSTALAISLFPFSKKPRPPTQIIASSLPFYSAGDSDVCVEIDWSLNQLRI
jgi:hypothetical protein